VWRMTVFLLSKEKLSFLKKEHGNARDDPAKE
jgi:hypothetical protein